MGEDRPLAADERGWDYARARAAGVNCIIENLGTYGYWNYNYSPKQTLRLIETFHRFAETHADKMGVARTVAEARAIVASGRMAVFLGIESGFDHEGDPDVLAAFYRLGLRSIQFATQSGFNAFSDSALAATQGGQTPDHYHGINERGRALVRRMNELGILIDITHGTEAVHLQLIEASRAPVVASHDVIRAVSGVGLSDAVLKALAAKGGLVGIHGGAAVVSKRYRKWMAENPAGAANAAKAVTAMVGFAPSAPRPPGDRGDYIAKVDEEFADRWKGLQAWREDPAPRCRRRRSGPNRSTMSSKPWVPTTLHWVSIWWRGVAPCRRHRPAIRICWPSCEGSRARTMSAKLRARTGCGCWRQPKLAEAPTVRRADSAAVGQPGLVRFCRLPAPRRAVA